MNSCGYCFLPYPNEKHLPQKGKVLLCNLINVCHGLVVYCTVMLKSPS